MVHKTNIGLSNVWLNSAKVHFGRLNISHAHNPYYYAKINMVLVIFLIKSPKFDPCQYFVWCSIWGSRLLYMCRW